MLRRHLPLLTLLAALGATVTAIQNPPAQPPAVAPAQQNEVQLVISSGTGAPPKYAVPDFLALSGDSETRAAAKTIAPRAAAAPGKENRTGERLLSLAARTPAAFLVLIMRAPYLAAKWSRRFCA